MCTEIRGTLYACSAVRCAQIAVHMMDMTATTATPQTNIAEYRRQERTRAESLGAPQDRGLFPTIHRIVTGRIFLRGTKLTYQADGQQPETLTGAVLDTVLGESTGSTVVADEATFSQVWKLATAAPLPDARSRRMKILKSLDSSTKLPILTRALARRYWLPADKDETDLGDWAEAFNLRAPSTSLTMKALIERASTSRCPQGEYERDFDRMATHEASILEGAQYTGIRSDCSIFSRLQSHEALQKGLRLRDRGLLPLHVLDGQACRIVPMNVNEFTFTASVSSPFKMKEGSVLQILDTAGSITETRLESLRFGSGEMHAVFKTPTARSGGRSLVEDAKRQKSSLYVVEKPFDLPGKGLKNRRWFEKEIPVIEGREVPMDILLAGAPTA